jgi:ribosome-associated translation inhibitor RaiA
MERGMNIDIQTDHVVMRPEWRLMIDSWLERCRRLHPDVVELDLSLRHGDRGRAEQVNVVATARGRSLSAGKQADMMSEALHEALDALEGELLVNEAVRPRPTH